MIDVSANLAKLQEELPAEYRTAQNMRSLALACDAMVKALVFFLNWRYLGLDESNQEAWYDDSPTGFIASSANAEEAPEPIRGIYDDLLKLHLVYASIVEACDQALLQQIAVPQEIAGDSGFWTLPERFIEAPPVAQLMLEPSNIPALQGIMVPFAIAPLSVWNQIRVVEVAIASVLPEVTFAGAVQNVATELSDSAWTAFAGLPADAVGWLGDRTLAVLTEAEKIGAAVWDETGARAEQAKDAAGDIIDAGKDLAGKILAPVIVVGGLGLFAFFAYSMLSKRSR